MGSLKRAAMFVVAHIVGTDDVALRDLRLTFRQLDKEGLGCLTSDQFLKGLREKMAMSDDEVNAFRNEIMPVIDLDGNDTITFTEFLAATIDLQGEFEVSSADNILRNVYQLLDADNSGALKADDLCDLFPNNPTEVIDDIMREAGAGKDGLTFEQFREYMMGRA